MEQDPRQSGGRTLAPTQGRVVVLERSLDLREGKAIALVVVDPSHRLQRIALRVSVHRRIPKHMQLGVGTR